MSTTTTETRAIRTDVAELRVLDEGGKPKIVGYAAVFNSFSEDLGGFREIIRPGAFANALKENQDVRALVNHDPSLLLGRTKAGTLKLSEDTRGLRVEIYPPETTAGKDNVESIRRGDIDGMSFGFEVRGGGKAQVWREENGKTIRELHDLNLFDVSPVTYPAYPATTVAVRSLEAWRKETAPGRDPAAALRSVRLAEAES